MFRFACSFADADADADAGVDAAGDASVSTGTFADGRAAGAGVPSVSSHPPDRPVGTRDLQIAGVIRVWNVMQHFHPFLDDAHDEWEAALVTAFEQIQPGLSEDEFLGVLRALVAALNDGQATVRRRSDPPLFQPPALLDWVDGKAVVTYVEESVGQSEGVADLAVGDVVVAFDGVESMKALTDRGNLISAATPQGQRSQLFQEILAGPQGEALTLTVEQPDGSQADVVLSRTVPLGSVREPKPMKVQEILSGIYYVDLERISDHELQAALPDLEKADSIVFDLRGVPGKLSPTSFIPHLIETPVAGPTWVVPLITTPSHRASQNLRRQWEFAPAEPYLKARRVFITSGSTVGYAELLAAMVQDGDLGLLVGQPTGGACGNRAVVELTQGIEIWFSGLTVETASGTLIHQNGIRPAVPAPTNHARSREWPRRTIDGGFGCSGAGGIGPRANNSRWCFTTK